MPDEVDESGGGNADEYWGCQRSATLRDRARHNDGAHHEHQRADDTDRYQNFDGLVVGEVRDAGLTAQGVCSERRIGSRA